LGRYTIEFFLSTDWLKILVGLFFAGLSMVVSILFLKDLREYIFNSSLGSRILSVFYRKITEERIETDKS
ncbi:MAG: hypothetical protein ACK419_01465, partial [Pyrinomonadaceae bacterium]